VESAVDPTRSQNITVSWRRSAWAGAGAGGGTDAGVAVGAGADATWVAAWYSYRRSFAPPFDIGVGTASAYVLAFAVGVLAIAYVKLIYRRIE
jgi:ABC-type sugar transport system permease subunit